MPRQSADCLVGVLFLPQSDNGSEFRNQVVAECVSVWPDLQMVHGSPRHSQSQVKLHYIAQEEGIYLNIYFVFNS